MCWNCGERDSPYALVFGHCRDCARMFVEGLFAAGGAALFAWLLS